jgi:hypothetical protein
LGSLVLPGSQNLWNIKKIEQDKCCEAKFNNIKILINILVVVCSTLGDSLALSNMLLAEYMPHNYEKAGTIHHTNEILGTLCYLEGSMLILSILTFGVFDNLVGLIEYVFMSGLLPTMVLLFDIYKFTFWTPCRIEFTIPLLSTNRNPF